MTRNVLPFLTTHMIKMALKHDCLEVIFGVSFSVERTWIFASTMFDYNGALLSGEYVYENLRSN